MIAGLREFEVRSREGDGALRTFAVHVPAGLCYFEGHFEGRPVLPAVALLNNLVLRLVREAWPDLARLRRATKLKFHRPVAPGADLTVRLERRGDAVTFAVEARGEPASTGALSFGEATP